MCDGPAVGEFVSRCGAATVRVRSPHLEQLRAVLVDAGLTVDTTPDALTVHDTSTDAVGELAARHSLALHELSPQGVSLEQAYLSSTDEATVYRGSAG